MLIPNIEGLQSALADAQAENGLLKERLAAYDRAAKEPVVLPDYMPRISDATLDNIIKQDEEGSVANAARILAAEVKFWHSKPLFTAPTLPVVPDAMLCDFYEVSSFPDLVRELVLHVEQLQEAVKRNVKPWEDTFPETLLPAYIERIKQEDDACRAAMLQPGNSPAIPEGSVPEVLRTAINKLFDNDGWRKCYSAIKCHDAHEEIERLLAAAPQPGKGE